MSNKFLSIFLILCLVGSMLNAQNKPSYKPLKRVATLSYSISYSDYGFIKVLRDSSFNAALNRKGLFKSGNSSFGFGVAYRKGIGSHIDFSLGLNGTFSNFPALFVKDDSIGNPGFTPQLDALLHIKALSENSVINPFLTGGIGAGYFGKQLAVYAPIGTGLQFKFSKAAYILVQAQWRMALTDGIKDDYMFYSLGFAQSPTAKTPRKKPAPKVVTPVVVDSTVKKRIIDSIMKTELDTDGDGIPDLRDECPNEKGTLRGCPDSDGDGIADKDDKCPGVKGDPRYKGCPVPDSDGDGINDDDDKCKTEAGTKENKGCPVVKEPIKHHNNGDDDTDGDGVLNKDDKCPDLAGTEANSGCPLKVVEVAGVSLIRYSKDSLTYSILFDLDKSDFTSQAFTAMKQIVDILQSDNSLSVLIEGFADNYGQEKYNLILSSVRANRVREYILSYPKNIGNARIKTAFYGSARPVDVNQNWLNRRVEITMYKK